MGGSGCAICEGYLNEILVYRRVKRIHIFIKSDFQRRK